MTGHRVIYQNDTSPQRVYVCFTDRQESLPWWVRMFTSRGYRHCLVLVPQKLGTVVVNQGGKGLTVEWYPVRHEHVADTFRLDGWRVVACMARPTRRFRLRGLISCVSVAKSLLGIEKWTIITPRQLFDHLEGRGNG